MPIKVGVALYLVRTSYDQPGYYHWAIVATKEESWQIQPVRVYEIKRGSGGRFVQSFTSERLDKSNALTGIVDLFTTNVYSSFDQILDRVCTIKSEDCGWRFPGRFGPPTGWDCSTWVLQALHRFYEDGAWNVPEEVFLRAYTTILNRASEMAATSRTSAIRSIPLIRAPRGYGYGYRY
ncbi:hypothetical protein NLJ89_g8912 [Agrocybe chaxingu]|uniref:Uncharacterized protein n=1 Tax=Agrocybe chaxingu TaxID=84603 RepID=A0A9W8JTR3_9AGAR|nr:hypothetical protein NLJ89_g8912 [Agrocybe chaxingu]